MRCDHCEPLLLDHLYGLLDPADAAAVDGHLAGCPACAAARDRAADTQRLFTRAARRPFPHVRFVPPADEPAVPSSLVVTARPGRRVAQWAVAAGLLALIPGALLPVDRLAGRYEAAKTDADEAGRRHAVARMAFERAADAGQQNVAQRRAAEAHMRAEEALADWLAIEGAARDGGVTVRGPRAVQPGAPNEFAVNVPPAAAAGKTVTAVVKGGGSDAPIYSHAVDPNSGKVRIPPDVSAKLASGEATMTVTAADPKTGGRTTLADGVRLTGAVYSTIVATDRPAYRPGERVYFRSLTLDRATHAPPDRPQVLEFTVRRPDGSAVEGAVVGSTDLVRVVDGKAEPVLGPDGQPVRGVGCGAFDLPATLPDGDYTLVVTEKPGAGGTPPLTTEPATRTFRVRAGGADKLAKRITFDAPSYSAGGDVTAWVDVSANGQPLAAAPVRVAVTADGQPLDLVPVRPNGRTDAKGRATVVFSLPKKLAVGDVRLLATVAADGAEEAVAARVPVAGKGLTVEFFPEGGALVAGVPNRVYVRATTPAGVPVEVGGPVKGPDGAVVATAAPADADTPRGLGSFTLTPAAGTVYALTLPAGRFELPKAAADGVGLTVADPVAKAGEPIRVKLYAPAGPRTLVVGAFSRGKLVDTKTVDTKPGGPAEVSLSTAADRRGGVVRVTVWDKPAAGGDLVPVAERLVFRTPAEVLNFALDPKTVPGGVRVGISATDETGRPAAAVAMAAVTAVPPTADARDRSLPTQVLLANEVRSPGELEYADILLSPKPGAAVALDALLGTQGWRRFVEQRGATAAGGTNADPNVARLIAQSGTTPAELTAAARREAVAGVRGRYEAAVAELHAARAALANTPSKFSEPATKALGEAAEAARTEARAAAVTASEAGRWLVLARGLGGLLVVLALAIGAVAVVRPNGLRVRRGAWAVAVAAGGLGVTLMAATPPVVAYRDAELVPTGTPGGPAPVVMPAAVPGGVPPVAPVVGEEGAEVSQIPPEQPFLWDLNGNNTRKTPAALVAPKGLDPLRGGVIGDDLLNRPAVGGPRAAVTPTPAAVVEAEKAADAAARALAGGRAAALLQPMGPAAREKLGKAAAPVARPLVVREYAAPRPGPKGTDGDGETLLWHPVIVLPADGKTTLEFGLGSAPGGYQVLVAGHTPDGRLGSVRAVLPAGPK